MQKIENSFICYKKPFASIMSQIIHGDTDKYMNSFIINIHKTNKAPMQSKEPVWGNAKVVVNLNIFTSLFR